MEKPCPHCGRPTVVRTNRRKGRYMKCAADDCKTFVLLPREKKTETKSDGDKAEPIPEPQPQLQPKRGFWSDLWE